MHRAMVESDSVPRQRLCCSTGCVVTDPDLRVPSARRALWGRKIVVEHGHGAAVGRGGDPRCDWGVPAADPAAAPWPFADHRSAESASDASKAPLSIDALYQLKNIDSPQWSPDGKRIAFSVASHDLPSGKTDADIYVVGADGTDLRQLTHFEGSDTAPRWSPDGKSLLFVSTRLAGAQVWILPADGGEARQLTHISTGVDSPIWSPDGKLIAFASRVYPEYGADDAANKALSNDIDKSTIKAHIADDLLFRHWDSYADGTRSHILIVDVATSKLTDVTPGDYDSPSFELGGGARIRVFS